MEFIPQADAVKKSNRLQEKTTLNILKGRSRWTAGRTVQVTGFDVVTDKDNPSSGQFLVLTTSINGQPFDNLFISMLVRPITDADGTDIEPNGSFNTIARQLLDDNTIQTDEQYAQRLVAATTGKSLRVKRDRKVTRMRRDGSLYPSTLVEFDLI